MMRGGQRIERRERLMIMMNLMWNQRSDFEGLERSERKVRRW